MRSNRRHRRKVGQADKAQQARRRAEYLERLTPDQLAAYRAEREYVAYLAENKPIRRPRPPRSPSEVQAR